jgi:hypothetical protein
MKRIITPISLAACACLGLAGAIPYNVSDHVSVEDATYQPSEIEAAKESIALSLMGQLQMSVADLMWLKSMEYLHKGQRQRMPTAGEENAGMTRGESGDTAPGLGHTEGVSMVLDKHRDWRGVLGDIERHVSTYSDGHGHDDPVELIPWYQLAVKLNPRLERLYTLGAFYMADFAGAPADAHALLVAGIEANPESFEVKAALGRLLHEYADRRAELASHTHGHGADQDEHDHGEDHDHEHEQAHAHGHDDAHDQSHAHGGDLAHGHDHGSNDGSNHGHGHDNAHGHAHGYKHVHSGETAREDYMPADREEAFKLSAQLLREAVDHALRLKLALRERQEAFDEFQEQVHYESYLFLSRSYVELEMYDEALAACDEGLEFAKHNLLRVQRRVVGRLMDGDTDTETKTKKS